MLEGKFIGVSLPTIKEISEIFARTLTPIFLPLTLFVQLCRGEMNHPEVKKTQCHDDRNNLSVQMNTTVCQWYECVNQGARKYIVTRSQAHLDALCYTMLSPSIMECVCIAANTC